MIPPIFNGLSDFVSAGNVVAGDGDRSIFISQRSVISNDPLNVKFVVVLIFVVNSPPGTAAGAFR
jgi:hypothetical protein